MQQKPKLRQQIFTQLKIKTNLIRTGNEQKMSANAQYKLYSDGTVNQVKVMSSVLFIFC